MYNNARPYKAKLKLWHDQLILRKKLEQFDNVLLYDFKLHLFSGKLRFHSTSPFIIKTIFLYGAIEIVDPKDSRAFKVNGQWLKLFLDDFKQESEGIQLGDSNYASWKILILFIV